MKAALKAASDVFLLRVMAKHDTCARASFSLFSYKGLRLLQWSGHSGETGTMSVLVSTVSVHSGALNGGGPSLLVTGGEEPSRGC